MNILYLDMEESTSNSVGSLIYYLIGIDNTGLVYQSHNKLENVSYEICCDTIKNLLDSHDCATDNTRVFTLSDIRSIKSVLLSYEDYVITNLSSFLGLNVDNIFDIFKSFYAIDTEVSYFNMLKAILCDKIVCKLGLSTCLRIEYLMINIDESHKDYTDVTICSFLQFNNEITKLDSQSYTISRVNTDSSYYDFNLLLDRVAYNIAQTGVSCSNIVPVYLSKFTYEYMQSLKKQLNITKKLFSRYPIIIKTCFSQYSDISFNTQYDFVRLFSDSFGLDKTVTANLIVNILIKISSKLGLVFSDNVLTVNNPLYRKNYAMDMYQSIPSRGNFGIILDCEGTSDGGCAQLGGLIYCQNGRLLMKLETFCYDDIDIVDGIDEIVTRFLSLSGYGISTTDINTLVYGCNDSSMILGSLRGGKLKHMRKRVLRMFKFVNCQDFINSYCENRGIKSVNYRLNTMAECLKVETVKPVHNALNDSKTLFNVLAGILYESGKFIVKKS